MLSLLLACASPPEPAATERPALEPTPAVSAPLPGWPDYAARLDALPVEFPEGFGVRRIFLDAGHGAPGNPGNTSAWCETESDVMFALSGPLGEALEATGHFEVLRSRQPGELVSYGDRLRAASAWGAEIFISLHSDARGRLIPWEPTPGQVCYHNPDAPGFSVLWSDEGGLAESRLALARALAASMSLGGFRPYDGGDYIGLYAPDERVAGVFVDRHEPRRRIRFLRRPTMPSVIIETHHALDPQAAVRFREPETARALHAAVIVGLVEAFRVFEAP